MAEQRQEQAAAAPSAAPAPKPKKKKGGCLKGCLIFFLVLLLLIGFVAAMAFKVPQRMGWLKGPGAKVTEGTPERETAAEIVAEAETKGFKSKAVEVYVLPKPESADAFLIATYDFSKDVELSRASAYHPVVDAFVLLGGGAKAQEHGVTYVAIEFLDEEGNQIMVVASSTADIRALMDGGITQEEFLKRMGKDIDYPNYVQRAVIPF